MNHISIIATVKRKIKDCAKADTLHAPGIEVEYLWMDRENNRFVPQSIPVVFHEVALQKFYYAPPGTILHITGEYFAMESGMGVNATNIFQIERAHKNPLIALMKWGTENNFVILTGESEEGDFLADNPLPVRGNVSENRIPLLNGCASFPSALVTGFPTNQGILGKRSPQTPKKAVE